MTTKAISGVSIPDSKLARQAARLISATETGMLFRHSTRVYFWAALTGARVGLKYDPELLYIGAMFHDVGLTPRYRKGELRFEVDGADSARDFMKSNGVPAQEIEEVWTAIALHITPGIPEHMHPDIALLQAGAAMDVVGRGYSDFTDEQRAAVNEAYPRGPDFGFNMIDAFHEGMKHRPGSTYGTFNDDILAFKDPAFQRGNLCSVILASPWER